ncbi:MAG: polysaccharide deacetylase family protein [Anaerolineales bacterium]|nr:polysaccharide deacetylase family protein [Anaerolineales bacterium]
MPVRRAGRKRRDRYAIIAGMLRLLLISLSLLALCACAPLDAGGRAPTPSAIVPVTGADVAAASTPTLTATPTRPATATPPPTATPEPSATASPEPSPTVTASATATLWPPPTPDAAAAGRQARLPILMYHYVEPWPANANELRRGLTVRPEDFTAQMDYLAQRGYVTVSLYDLADALATGRPLPERAVVLTFDDGYRTLVDYAWPILSAHGYTGTVFAITELMDKGLEQYLTWDQARALFAAGWRIEPHTKTHVELAGRSDAKQLYEILGAVETIAANLGVRPRFLCYPAGKYDATSLRLAPEIQLWGAVTTRPGRTHTFADRFTWTRVRVDGRGSLKDFITAVEGDLR